MQRFVRASAFAVLSAAVCSVGLAQQTAAPEQGAAAEVMAKLKAIPGVTDVQVAQGRGRGGQGAGAAENFQLTFEQPVDHKDPSAGKFQQRFYVTHVDFDKPVILGTEGYAANGAGGGGELRGILGASNVITVEHRYFGRSVPAAKDGSVPWQYLTVKNAADDMHGIVSAMKTLYHGKWVATGTSKGGQTSLFYKCYYPDDVNATVAYVAPMNIGQEDPRINMFINSVGDEATRKKIKDFQIALLKDEDKILPLIQEQAGTRMTFSMGLGKAYEYGVLEYPYYFWQYGLSAADIPDPNSTPAALEAYYMRTNTIRYYSDQGKKQFEPFLYQAFTEIGYYNYDITDFKQYLKSNPNPTNLDICPDGTKDKIVYNPDTMAFVFNYLQYKANNVAYIYGETDAWSATQMQLLGRTNAIKIVCEGAHHNASVRSMSAEQKTLFYDNLEKWMDMKVNRQ